MVIKALKRQLFFPYHSFSLQFFTIKRGETQRVEFDLQVCDLGFYTNSMKYVVEPGEFEIMVGPNSEELKTKTVVWEK